MEKSLEKTTECESGKSNNLACILCFRRFVHGDDAYDSKSIFKVCSHYLKGSFKNSSKWSGLSDLGKSCRFCKDCVAAGEKLLLMERKLKEIQTEIENFVKLLTGEILEHRKKERIEYSSSDAVEMKYNIPMGDVIVKEEIVEEGVNQTNVKCELDIAPSPCSPEEYFEMPQVHCNYSDEEQENMLQRNSQIVSLQSRQVFVAVERLQFDAKGKIKYPTCERNKKTQVKTKKSEMKTDEDFSDDENESEDSLSESDENEMEDETRKRKRKRKTRNEKRFKCRFCPVSYAARRDCDIHTIKEHNEEGKVHTCHSCEYETKVIRDFVMHLRRHEKVFNCQECGKRFGDRFLFEIHCMEHKNEIRFECQLCHDEFSNMKDFSDHQKFSSCSTHFGDFKCDVCGKLFNAQYLLLLHQVFKHDYFKSKNDKGNYNCHLCTGVLAPTFKRQRLEVHFLLHTKESPLSCDICGIPMRCQYVLAGHRLTHKAKETEKFACSQCDKSFNQFRTLKKHIQRSHNESAETLTCQFENCGKGFKLRDDYEKHVRTHVDRMPCDVCQKVFSSAQSLRAHKGVHTGKFKCGQCDLVFGYASALKSHVANVHLKEKNFVCEVCGRGFFLKSKYEAHLKTHEAEKEDLVCNICGHPFTRDYYLKDHMRIHTGEPQDRSDYQFICDICGKQFRAQSSVTDHKKRHHLNGDKTESCQVCGKIFAVGRGLKRHMARNHNANGQIFECATCGKKLKTKNELNIHMKSHTIRIPCGLCDKTFPSGTQVKIHRLSHNTPSIPCPTCHKKFASPVALKSHIDNVHLKIKNHFCDICGKGFFKKAHYKAHRGIHSDELSFECKKCGEKFNTEHKLVDHKRKDHSNGPFDCQICGKTFLRKTTLNLHIKKHKTKDLINF